MKKTDLDPSSLKDIIKEGRDKYIFLLRKDFDQLFKSMAGNNIEGQIEAYGQLAMKTNMFNAFVNQLRNDLIYEKRVLEKGMTDEQDTVD